MAAVQILFPLALLALGLVALVAARRRILAVMAFRNSLRRPRQSVLVVLGLLVGTALVSGALVASDSMEYAIVEATYDAFQHIDETVYVDGYHFYPRYVEDELAAHAGLAAASDGVGSNILWEGSAANERSGLYEPSIRLVGFDPQRDQAFGDFRRDGRTFDGTDLAPHEVVLNADLAEALGAREGDALTLNFSRPLDPVLPRFEAFEGRIAVSAGGLPLLPQYAEPQPASFTVPVDRAAVRLAAVVGWEPGAAGQDLDVEVTAPSGQAFRNANGTVGAPDVPAVLNVTGSLAQPLETGPWTVTVHAKAAAATPFNVTVVLLEPVYAFAEFEQRAEELRERFPDFDPSEAEAPRESRTARVAWIMEEGKGPDFALPNHLNAFVRLDALQEWLGREGQVNFVKVSNPGGVQSGAERSAEVLPVIRAALNESKARHPEHPAVQALKADDDKVFWLGQARQVGELFSVFLTSIASFSIVAGLMLIINIFTMLAEERKAELGMSRAVGLRRGGLSWLFTFEGALYALPAAVLGTFAGLGLARGLIWGFNVFGDEGLFPGIPFRVEGRSLLLAFAIGVLLTLGTVYVGARRISRLNVVRAIRNLEEPERMRTRVGLWVGTFLMAAGVAATLGGYAAHSFALQVLGPSVLAVGLGLYLRRHFRRKALYPPLAAALFAYLTATLFLIRQYETLEANIFGPIRAVIMAICVVLIVVYNERAAKTVGTWAMRLKPIRASAIVGTSYPLHRKFRTGMTLAMYSVILLVVSLFTIFGALFTPDPAREAGGYDVQATSHVRFDDLRAHGDPAVLDRVAYYDSLPYFLQIGEDVVKVENETPGQFGPPRDLVFGIDERFARQNEFALLRRDAAFATDLDAYLAAARGDAWAVVAYPYSTDQQGNDDVHRVGDTLQVQARGGVKEFRIAGIQEQSHFKGLFVSREALGSMFGRTETFFLLALREGEDPERAAEDLERAYRDVALDAEPIEREVLEETQQFRQIFTLIQLFLSLGLVIGILSLGIVTARSVIERRQEIGMMRALGYKRRDIRRTFLLEVLTMVTLGVGIGAALAILVSFGLWVAIVRELNVPYVVPWGELGVIALIAYVATTLATLAPIVRASRVPPAEALRYIE